MPSPDAGPEIDRAAWAARFGWLVGALAGLLAGFALTYLLEVYVLAGRVADPKNVAARASSVLVGGAVLAGAVMGHAFGSRGGRERYRLLGAAAGVLLAVVAWAALVVWR